MGFRRGWRVVQPGSSLPLGAVGQRGLWAGGLRPAVSDRRPSTGSCVSWGGARSVESVPVGGALAPAVLSFDCSQDVAPALAPLWARHCLGVRWRVVFCVSGRVSRL